MSKKETSPPFGLEGHDGVATRPSAKKEVSMSTITIGVDLAKSVFSVCEVDSNGHVRIGHIDATRPFTEMQSDHRQLRIAPMPHAPSYTTGEMLMPNAKGKVTTRAQLTGESFAELLGKL